jgi:hypothetical protein
MARQLGFLLMKQKSELVESLLRDHVENLSPEEIEERCRVEISWPSRVEKYFLDDELLFEITFSLDLNEWCKI